MYQKLQAPLIYHLLVQQTYILYLYTFYTLVVSVKYMNVGPLQQK